MSTSRTHSVARIALTLFTTIVTIAVATKASAQPAAAAHVSCTSTGARQHCAADTSAGVLLERSIGTGACLLGKTWGYDDTGVWVSDGCSGEFQTGPGTPAGAQGPDPTQKPFEPIETWGEFDPGKGFVIGKSSLGELDISGYALVRYVDQMPGEQTFTDHLGNTRTSDGRNDI
jgi:hypothetical protein